MMRFFPFLIFSFLTLLSVGQSTVELVPTKDNTLYQDATGETSNGVGNHLFVGNIDPNKNPEKRRRIVLQWDVASAIPAGSTILDVSLQMYLNREKGDDVAIDLFTLTRDWGEGNSDAPNMEGEGTTPQTDDATWVHAFYPAIAWTPGGEFDITSSATQTVNDTGFYTWQDTTMVNDVQGWLDNPGSSYGYIMVADETKDQHAKRFTSKDNPVAAQQPKLIITFDGPCIDPVINDLAVANNPLCPDSSTTIVVSGELNRAETWVLYAGGCPGTEIDRNPEGRFTVSPIENTTYSVRGEGGCITPGNCETITLSMATRENAAFTYPSDILCENGNSVDPTLIGDPGNNYTAQPNGLDLDPVSGVVNPTNSNIGTYLVTRTTSGSCPGSFDYTLTIAPIQDTFFTAEICNGASYNFGGQTLTNAGVYYDTLMASTGCDSAITLQLDVVNQITNLGNSETICEGDSLVVGNEVFKFPGNYQVTMVTAAGCDSVYGFSLTLSPAFETETSLTRCAGEVYDFNGRDIRESGTYTEVFESASGCDSTVELTIDFIDEIIQRDTAFLCEGDTLLYQGNTITAPGRYGATYSTAGGCDSSFVIRVYPGGQVQRNEFFRTICQGDSVLFAGVYRQETGVYQKRYAVQDDCDSIAVLRLEVEPVNIAVVKNGNSLTAQASDASYQWLDCVNGFEPIANATFANFTTNISGRFAVAVTQGNCTDTSACYQISPVGVKAYPNTAWVSLQPNPAYHSLRIATQFAGSYRILDLAGKELQHGRLQAGKQVISLTALQPGSYLVVVSGGMGQSTHRIIKL